MYGDRALGPFNISMAKGPDDALAVLLLARAGGCVRADGSVPLDVAPLFETVDDLEAGPDVLRALASDPTYAEHLTSRGNRQIVMLGYSDSNKDGGIAASRVGLDRAQHRLVAVAAELGLQITFFHGRGGSTSRGGSKPRSGILAAPPGALGGHVRTTEQGEIIGAKFGLRGIAERTLEVSLGALLERTAGGDPARAATDEQRAIANTLSAESRVRYRALVHDEPDFPALFQGMTPIDVIERLDIGSRPARRREMRGVGDLRAIPWVFAWTQCRAVLPGWFGVGSGLVSAIEAYGLDSVRSAVREWAFLDTFLSDVEMVLAKSDLDIAARYAELAGDVGARLFPMISEEHARCIETILELREASALLERDPSLQRSIRLRNPYVDPMSFVQVDFLRRWREGGREDPELERVLVQTVRGIARGLRNTG
ncbi:MAG: phosphoenolpyruvate carboxylase [Planctomycetota bacterium]|jgi:phosphoenolpyruvate carboxylase